MAATHYDRFRRHVRRLMDHRGHPRRLHMSHFVRMHRRGRQLSRTQNKHRQAARLAAKSARLKRKLGRKVANHGHVVQHSAKRRQITRQLHRVQRKQIRRVIQQRHPHKGNHNPRSGAAHRQTRRYR
jgi:hypothetical protein